MVFSLSFTNPLVPDLKMGAVCHAVACVCYYLSHLSCQICLMWLENFLGNLRLLCRAVEFWLVNWLWKFSKLWYSQWSFEMFGRAPTRALRFSRWQNEGSWLDALVRQSLPPPLSLSFCTLPLGNVLCLHWKIWFIRWRVVLRLYVSFPGLLFCMAMFNTLFLFSGWHLLSSLNLWDRICALWHVLFCSLLVWT